MKITSDAKKQITKKQGEGEEKGVKMVKWVSG
jgi:hypothetical protein